MYYDIPTPGGASFPELLWYSHGSLSAFAMLKYRSGVASRPPDLRSHCWSQQARVLGYSPVGIERKDERC